MKPKTYPWLIPALLIALPGAAQYYPNQTYPNSTYPSNTRVRRGSSPKTTGIPGSHGDITGTFHGLLKDVNSKEIVIQNDEDQTVVIRRSKKTKFLKDGKEIKPSLVAMNVMVSVDASEDVDLKPIAVTVTLDSSKQTSTAPK